MILSNRHFFENVKKIILKARMVAYYSVNKEMLKAYFEIGKRIVEEEQHGKKRADYGKSLIDELSKELTKSFKRGFSSTSLKNMRLFYKTYKDSIGQSMTDESFVLSWTHYCELIKINDKYKRKYFEKYALNDNLSVRDLKRQINSLHYERLIMSKDKKLLINYERNLSVPSKSTELFKDPYILDFLDLEEKKTYNEKELETSILNKLQTFLLELGQGFSFVARQKRFTIDNEHYYIDLLFYNIYLKCYVILELKTSKFRHVDAGQMNFYLNYVKKELNNKEDNAPIGIILCTDKHDISVEYATSGIENQVFVSKYKLYLPSKKQLLKEIKDILNK
ncbi:MAG: PDDEXK nuclease domain-containing protein [Candidatus Woesearchaeota archaeon]